MSVKSVGMDGMITDSVSVGGVSVICEVCVQVLL